MSRFLTTEQLAELAGVSAPSVMRFERGENGGDAITRLPTLQKLAKALGVPPGTIGYLDYEEEEIAV